MGELGEGLGSRGSVSVPDTPHIPVPQFPPLWAQSREIERLTLLFSSPETSPAAPASASTQPRLVLTSALTPSAPLATHPRCRAELTLPLAPPRPPRSSLPINHRQRWARLEVPVKDHPKRGLAPVQPPGLCLGCSFRPESPTPSRFYLLRHSAPRQARTPPGPGVSVSSWVSLPRGSSLGPGRGPLTPQLFQGRLSSPHFPDENRRSPENLGRSQSPGRDPSSCGFPAPTPRRGAPILAAGDVTLRPRPAPGEVRMGRLPPHPHHFLPGEAAAGLGGRGKAWGQSLLGEGSVYPQVGEGRSWCLSASRAVGGAGAGPTFSGAPS